MGRRRGEVKTRRVSKGAFEGLWAQPAKPRIAELLVRENALARAVFDGNWKYISTLRWFPPRNDFPEIATSLRKHLSEYREYCAQRRHEPIKSDAARTEEEIQRLKALGYL